MNFLSLVEPYPGNGNATTIAVLIIDSPVEARLGLFVSPLPSLSLPVSGAGYEPLILGLCRVFYPCAHLKHFHIQFHASRGPK